jgi:chloramphenicol-sensitive protein RarD
VTRDSSKGLAPAVAAFTIWGVFPLYFYLLRGVSPLQIIAHRVVWSCLLVIAWIGFRDGLHSLRPALANRGVLWRLGSSASLISVNWLIYVWAVAHGHVVETSLGYFIGPLVNVLLGVVILRESLTAAQWTAVAVASIGVGYLAILNQALPYIALALAVSFSVYGFIRKVVNIEALPGLAIETSVLFPLAAGYLVWCAFAGTGSLGHAGPEINSLLIISGPITAFALFLYAYGTRLLPYSTVGLLQFIAPTLQFTCGVAVLHEPFSRERAFGFTIIWAALLIYAADGLRQAHAAGSAKAAGSRS